MARKRDVSKKTGRRPSKAQDMIPKGYHELLTQIKERIRTAQLRPWLSTGNLSNSTGLTLAAWGHALWSEECQRRVGHARNYPMLTSPTKLNARSY